MVINTRNFILYLLSVGFLILAITYTATSSPEPETTTSRVLPPEETIREYGAEAVVTPALNRSEMLAAMREKVAQLSPSFQASVSEAPPRVPDVEEQSNEVRNSGTVLTCADYEVAEVVWQPQGAAFSVVEGARLLARSISVATTTASGTIVTDMVTEVLAQLPLRSLPLPMKSCLPTDVVGIALDGSLIRNDELSLYAIFGADTLLGYALDGFPLYGTNDTLALDECGGAVVSGQYRYYLSGKRDAILYCYAGIPIDL